MDILPSYCMLLYYEMFPGIYIHYPVCFNTYTCVIKKIMLAVILTTGSELVNLYLFVHFLMKWKKIMFLSFFHFV
jgi:hypothetical protein